MKKLLDRGAVSRSRPSHDRKSGDCRRSVERSAIRALFVSPDDAAHAGPSVSTGFVQNLAIVTMEPKFQVQMHAVQFSRIVATAVRGGRIKPISIFAAPGYPQRLPARAHSAPLTRASPESRGRRDGVSIGSFSPSRGPSGPLSSRGTIAPRRDESSPGWPEGHIP